MKTNKFMNNQEISRLLKAVSAAYEVKGENRFKVFAYDRAAVAVEHATSELKDLWDDGKLEEISGVGKSIASHLDELFRTGKVKHFQQVFKDLPEAMFEFLKIQGIGPKTAYKLCRKLKISESENALLKLAKAARKGRIAVIEGFGAKSETLILEGIRAFQKGVTKQNRMTLPYADGLSQEIIGYLSQSPDSLQADCLGSLRRKVATIGDIDIAVATKNPSQIVDWFCRFPKRQKIIEKGPSGATILLENGRQVDLRVQKPASYGAMLQYFTGSKQHNIHLRELALKKGLSLSEHGIKSVKGLKLKVKNYSNEEGFYKALGLFYIPPEIREDNGEIEASLQNELPKLIELKDIKGDLHVHSNIAIEESHDPGVSSMRDMVKQASRLGYEYIGFSEHNPSQSQHTQAKIIQLIRYKKEAIKQLNYSRVNNIPKILNGLEVDIKPNGDLALPEKALNLLDYVIVSVHSEFGMTREKMTKRILQALAHPKVKIFGHPTGRILNKREGYELDWEKIFVFCLKNDKWLEINAFPDRLDLPDNLVREAVKLGVKMIINTDAHAIEQLVVMKYGVEVARRGWATKNNIVNCLSYDKIREILEGPAKF